MKWSVLVFGILALAHPAHAQGLLWKLPQDGTWIRYEGTYSQLVRRPDSSEGDLELTWRQNLTIKSVGQEQADFNGSTVPCRWIEFKVETGKASEGILDAGPGGIRMFKLLIPEETVRGSVTAPIGNDRNLFVSHLEFVKGYRKVGDEPSQEIESGVFQLYPLISLLRHYRDLQTSSTLEDVTTPAGTFPSTLNSGKIVIETPVQRSTNSAEFYRSDASPFGLVKWTASTVRERKGTVDPRTSFAENVVLKEEMQAIEIGEGAESEFLVN